MNSSDADAGDIKRWWAFVADGMKRMGVPGKPWTQRDLGFASGLSNPSVVSYWATGKREPTRDNIRAVCDAIGREYIEGAVAAGIVRREDLTVERLIAAGLVRREDELETVAEHPPLSAYSDEEIFEDVQRRMQKWQAGRGQDPQ